METSKRPFAWHVLHALLIQLLLILFTACGSPPEMFFAGMRILFGRLLDRSPVHYCSQEALADRGRFEVC